MRPARAGPSPSCRSRRIRLLFFTQLDDALPRRLQLMRETDRVHRGSDLRYQVDDQTVVALPQTFAYAW